MEANGVITQNCYRIHNVLRKYCARKNKIGEKENSCCILVFENAQYDKDSHKANWYERVKEFVFGKLQIYSLLLY